MTTIISQLPVTPVYNNLEPSKGPQIAKGVISFDADGRASVNLNGHTTNMDFVQSVWVDNDSNALITITHRSSGFRVLAEPRTQGWYTMIATDELVFDLISTIPNTSYYIGFANFETDSVVQSTQPGVVSGISSGNPVPVQVSAAGVVSTQVIGTATASLNLAASAVINKFSYNASATTNVSSLLTGSVSLAHLSAWNSSASDIWLKLFDKATAPVLGTDTPVFNIYVPAKSNQIFNCGPMGIRFTAGFAHAMTAGAALKDATPLPAADTAGFVIARV